MFVKLLDLETNQTVFTMCDRPVRWWVDIDGNGDGGGGCDCNRIIAFTDVDADEYTQRLGLDDTTCLGTKRFVAVDVVGNLEGYDAATLVKKLNANYPIQNIEVDQIA